VGGPVWAAHGLRVETSSDELRLAEQRPGTPVRMGPGPHPAQCGIDRWNFVAKIDFVCRGHTRPNLS